MHPATFSLVPYVGAEPLSFGMKESAILVVLGAPDSIDTRQPIDTILDYPKLFVAYDRTTNTFRRVTFTRRATLLINGENALSMPDLIDFLLAIDSSPRDFTGILLFEKLGIGVSGFRDRDVRDSDNAVTVFTRANFDELFSRSGEFKGMMPNKPKP